MTRSAYPKLPKEGQKLPPQPNELLVCDARFYHKPMTLLYHDGMLTVEDGVPIMGVLFHSAEDYPPWPFSDYQMALDAVLRTCDWAMRRGYSIRFPDFEIMTVEDYDLLKSSRQRARQRAAKQRRATADYQAELAEEATDGAIDPL